MFDPTKVSALIVGLARNCAPALRNIRPRMDAMRASFGRTEFCFVTNDSKDDTLEYLNSWAEQCADVKVIELRGFAQKFPLRTDRIAQARNAYMKYLRDRAAHGFAHDLLVVADMDGVNTDLVAEPRFGDAIRTAPDGWGGIFANQRSRYYDIWALRHPTWCPDDCWKPAQRFGDYKLFGRHPMRLPLRPRVARLQVHIDPLERPIEVQSAFGGFGIYQTKFLQDAVYRGVNEFGYEVCEHVGFNSTVRQNGGRLWIIPSLLNSAPEEHLFSAPVFPAVAPRPWANVRV